MYVCVRECIVYYCKVFVLKNRYPKLPSFSAPAVVKFGTVKRHGTRPPSIHTYNGIYIIYTYCLRNIDERNT